MIFKHIIDSVIPIIISNSILLLMSYVYYIFNLFKLTHWNKRHKITPFCHTTWFLKKKKYVFSHFAIFTLFFVISETHKREIFTMIEAERFITYSLLTLFVYPLTTKLRIQSCSSRVLITSFCALPCPSFSRNSGRTRRNICENRKVESRE